MIKFDVNKFNLSQNYVIEASAGTGKTYNIVEIVSKIVNNSEYNINIDQILIVTYTEKAAGELKDRIRDKLKNINVDNAPIFTIHSFCQNSIKEFGLSAKLPLNLKVINNYYLDDFIKRYIRENDILDYISIFTKYDLIKSTITIENLLKSGINQYYLDINYNIDPSILTYQKIENDYEYLQLFKLINTANSFDDVLNNHSKIKYYYNILSSSNIEKTQSYAESIKDTYKDNFKSNYSKIRLSKSWPNDALEIEAFNFFKALNKKLSKCSIDKLIVSVFLNDAYIKWQKEKELHQEQNFNDMLRYVREQVIHNEVFKNKLKDKYKIAIIDEFQDTNQLQFDIFKNIFMSDDSHRIIVVGDPKQSIYSFQGSDVFVYYNAVDDIINSGGIKCVLNKNYRSCENVVKSCNKLFHYFDFDNTTFNDCNYLNIKEDDPLNIPHILYEGKETTAFWIGSNDLEQIDENQFAKIVVEQIIDCCSKDEKGFSKLRIKEKKSDYRNVTFKDFTILAKTSSEMKVIEKALKNVGIPYIRYKDKQLFIGKECYNFITLLKAINSIDFTGYNRNLYKKALYTDFFKQDISVLNSKYVSLDNTYEMNCFNKWKQFVLVKNWEALFDDIISNSKITKSMNSLKEIQSFSKYKQLANYCVDYLTNNKSLSDLILNLTSLSDNNNSDDDENGALVERSTDFDCVQIMTMYASKGLQFPIVISFGGFRKLPSKSCLYKIHEHNQQILTFDNTDTAKKESQEEIKRLLYVAYTRPEYLLMLPNYQNTVYPFMKDTIKKFMDNCKDSYKIINYNNTPLNELRKSVSEILKDDSISNNVPLYNKQNKVLNKLIHELKYKTSYKHSYSSMSHSKVDTEFTNEGKLIDKEGSESIGLFNYDKSAKVITPKYNNLIEPITLPIDYPSGSLIGTALHEIFEGLDFQNYQNNLDDKIYNCFNNQGIKTKEEWVLSTKLIVENVLNAVLPVVHGSDILDEEFSLNEISFDNKLDEVEFNFNLLEGLLKNYCNGFIDMIFRRGEYYSIVDWKSDKLNDILISYSSTECIKKHVDNRYAVQRVLYPYCLINYLQTSMKELSKEEIFQKHFGGMYYVFLRGCNKETGNGIYCQTWSSYKELEDAFNEIINDKVGGKYNG